MSWLKDVFVDIIASAIIIISVLVAHPALIAIVWGYTGLLLFVKLMVFFGDDFLNLMNKAKSEAPEWFSHFLYALNTAVLLLATWWYVGMGWALIWVFSFLTQRKLNRKRAHT